jgi:uncharacterized damage-inducible protein DinB
MTAPQGLSAGVSQSLSAHYDRVRQKVHALVEPLSAEQLWQRPFRYGNSVGHLLLHLTGNLRYYIGAQIAGSGYVRDRPREFADSSRRGKDEVLRDFDSAVDMVLATLAAQAESDWCAAYHAVGAEDVPNRLGMFLRCAAHADHHLGQMIYLCKQLALGTGGGMIERQGLRDAIHYWEPRRANYNAVLAVVAVAWVVWTWPHFRGAVTPQHFVALLVLATLANLCYCAAYLVDIPAQCSPWRAFWLRGRWVLWLAGTLLAVVLENYWIADEIYPSVR